MKSEDWVLTVLRDLAEQDSGLEAPLAVEDRVRKAFRRKHATRKWRSYVAWGMAAAALIAVGILAGLQGRRSTPVVPQRVEARPPQLAVSAPPEAVPVEEPKVPAPVRKQVQPRNEIVTQFFPLQDASMPFERGELLRVTVPASTMRKVGLPVNEDRLGERVYADVLVGQEGLARAIRFVSYEQ